jgi:phospholipase/carboxylesterase
MTSTYEHIFLPGTDSKAPALLLLHGTGGTEHDLVPIARSLSPGSAILSPRGKVSENGASRYFARLAEGVFDPAEVTQQTHSLADFISASAQAHRIDLTRLIAVGFSNGANIAVTLLLLRPIVLAGAVLFRPMVVIDAPAAPRSLSDKRVLIASGTRDPLVPIDHPNRLAAHLRAGGAEVTLHTHPAGHAITSSDIAAATNWFAASASPSIET